VNSHTVRLAWSTVTETNNFGFEIQKSVAQDENYETITGIFIPGHGTTLKPQTYSVLDTAASFGTWYYRLKQTDLDGTVNFTDGIRVEVSQRGDMSAHASNHALLQNYPDPCNPTTTIKYDVARTGDHLPANGQAGGLGVNDVRLVVYDLLGREVAVLVNEQQAPGSYAVKFDGSGLASGVYLYRLAAGSFVQTRKMAVVK